MTAPSVAELDAAAQLYERLDRHPPAQVEVHRVFPMLAWRDKLGDIVLLNRPKVVKSSQNRVTVSGNDVVGEEFKITLHGSLARNVRAQIEELERTR